MSNPLPELLGLGWLLQAVPIHVIEPPVHRAADPAIRDAPICERDEPMRAVHADEPRPPGAVPKQHEVFAQDPDLLRLAVRNDVGGQAHRMPVAAHVFATWRPRTDMGNK